MKTGTPLHSDPKGDLPSSSLGAVFKRIVWTIIAATLLAATTLAAGTGRLAQLTLNWVDNSGGAARFIIERKTGTAGTYTPIATTGSSIITYKDSAIVGGTTYCYRVKASNASGESDYSNEACASDIARFEERQ